MIPADVKNLENSRRELARIAGGLDLPRVILLQRMASTMTTEIEKSLAPDSDITTHNFEVAFSNQLLIHHATSDEPLKKKSFEYLLRTAFEADSKSAEINPHTKSWDVKADGERFSCKTEAESNMSPRLIRIQKLMDATWVRDCRDGEDYARKASKAFPAHLAHYDRILVLRVFRELERDALRYQLVEIPKAILQMLGQLDPATVQRTRGKKKNRAFAADVQYTPSGGAPVRAFRVLFDRSVGKVRIHSLNLDLCTVHGEWRIPLPGTGEVDEDEEDVSGATGE